MKVLWVVLRSAVLGWAVWFFFRLWADGRSTVTWTCDADGCGTNDVASVAPYLALVCAALLVLAVRPLLDRATLGAVVAGTAWAARSALQSAVGSGAATPAEVEGWSRVAGYVLVVGLVLAAAGLVRSIHETGLLLRMAGRASAPARIRVQTTGGTHTVSLVFFSRDGVRREVPLESNVRTHGRDVVALYDPVQPDWPGRVRVGLRRPTGTPASQRRRAERLREDLPFPEETAEANRRAARVMAGRTPPPAPRQQTRAETLVRIEGLRAAGFLSDQAAEQAGAWVVAQMFRQTFPLPRR